MAQSIEAIFQNKDYDMALAEVELITQKITLEGLKKVNASLDPSAREKLADTFFGLMDRYFKSKIASLKERSYEAGHSTPEEFVTLARLLKFYSITARLPFPIMPEEYIYMTGVDSPYFHLKDPQALQAIRDFSIQAEETFSPWAVDTNNAIDNHSYFNFTDQAIQTAPYIRFMRDYLEQNPKEKQALVASLQEFVERHRIGGYINTKDEDLLALLALTDILKIDVRPPLIWENRLQLPKEVKQARAAWFYAAYPASGKLTVPEEGKNSPGESLDPEQYAPRFVIKYLAHQDPWIWAFRAGANWCGGESYRMNSNMEVTQKQISSKGLASVIYEEPKVPADYVIIPTAYYQIQRGNPNAIAIEKFETELRQEMTFFRDDFRAWREIFSSPVTQLQRAFSYMQEHPVFLADEAQAGAFQMAFLHPGLLEKELEMAPDYSRAFVERLGDFLSHNLELFQKMDNKKTVAFLLDVSREVASRVAMHQLKHPEDFPPGFIPHFPEVKGAIAQLLESAESSEPKLRTYLHFQMVLALRDEIYFTGELKPKEAEELLVHSAKFGMVFGSEEFADYKAAWEHGIRRVLYYHKDRLQQLLSREPDIATRALQRILGTSVERAVPDPHFPYFKAKAGKELYSFNALTRDIRLDSVRIKELPFTFTQDPLFKSLWRELKHPVGKELDLNHFQIVQEGVVYDLIKKPWLKIRRSWGNEVLEYVAPSSLQFANQAIQKGMTGWAGSDGLAYLFTAKGVPHAIFEPLDGENVPSMERQKLTTFTIWKCDGQGRKGRQCLEDPEKDPRVGHILSPFEDPAEMMIWKDAQTNEIQEIELPRYNLSFKAKELHGGQVYTSDQFPGYCIAPQQMEAGIHALVLESEKDPLDKLVLLPRQTFQRKERWQSVEATPLRFEKKREFYRYRFAPPTMRTLSNLVPDSGDSHSKEEASLYLARMLLWRHEYTAGLALLQRLTPAHRFSASESSLVDMVVAAAKSDETPFSTDVGLFAAFARARSEALLKTESPILLRLAELYENHLTIRSRQTLNPLTPDQEMALYLMLPEPTPLMKERLALLKATGQIAASEILTEQMEPQALLLVEPTLDVPSEVEKDHFCLALEQQKDPLAEPLLSSGQLKEIVVVQETGERAGQVAETIERLKSIYTPSPHADRMERLQFAQQQKALDDYYERIRGDLKDLGVCRVAALRDTLKTAREQIVHLDADLHRLERDIFRLGDKAPGAERERALRETDLRTGKFRKRDLADFIELFRKRDTEAFSQANPALIPEEGIPSFRQ